ncbi:hypothetical protein QFZ77_000016 [Paenibacillus sp. V4I3]|uniref:hypothetical protein n=1 Tax=Paenibacillus sp. V4I3 TaxID=3042305 RepID=UPI00277E25AC|nr:hypothetical protein [Paenibacillus sp. V4I3]MDQ0871357.1 hypothetical protein [Paenibacillus sp. V4I3]
MEQVEYMLCDEAIITNKGFLFKDNYYTCQFALKKQLFSPENCVDRKLVEVLYEPLSIERILLKLEDWKYCFAYLLKEDDTMTQEEVEEYHTKIQILKQNHLKVKKRKIQRTIIVADNNNCS